jgi:predicted PurR-regulated permease PerM
MFFNKNILNALLVLVIFGFLAWFFSDIVTYLVLSLVLSGVLKTPTNYLSQLQVNGVKIIPRGLAILISFAIFAAVIALFILLFIPLVSDQIAVISSIPYDDLFDRIIIPLQQLENLLIDNNIIDQPKGFIMLELKSSLFDIFGKLKFSTIINNIISTTSNFFVGLLAVLFITFFLLFEKGMIRRNLIALIPNKYFEVSISALYKIEHLLSNYLLGLLVQITSIFSMVSFGLIIGGVKYAVTIGVFAALANLIPFLGPVIGGIFGLIIGISTAPITEMEGSSYILLVIKIMSVFGVVQVTDNILLQPLIFSKSVKAHPLEIFLIVFVGATLGGIPGMVLAIPSYTIIRVSFIELRKGFREYRIFQSLKAG